MCACSKSLQSCLTLCDSMDCSPLGSSVHGILQARIVEWVAMCCSRGSSQPRDRTRVFCTGRQILYHWGTWEAGALKQLNPHLAPPQKKNQRGNSQKSMCLPTEDHRKCPWNQYQVLSWRNVSCLGFQSTANVPLCKKHVKRLHWKTRLQRQNGARCPRFVQAAPWGPVVPFH